ncbi:FMN reductase [Plantactinospora endophytica]|uniref:FMN reductase n=1 Tax=Plantactinospora endophytica TaxID=673535 RepID=A0ABQ4DX46_9ACTN|nr:FMN reductase [Plantactinospora endophytica]GIG87043.1 FMN reductase [Plantactinospora endophytica]
MTDRTLAVVSAGLRVPSSTRLLADQLAQATAAELDRRGVPVRTELVELRDHGHDVVNNLLAGFPSEALRRALDTVAGADGLIVVTPIFNASYSGLFKSFFDVLGDDALVDRPVLIGATGGTARHSLALEHALRPMFSYLRAVVMPTSVFAAPEDWAGGSAQGTLRGRIDRAARELAEQVGRREPAEAADPFRLTTTFDQLLAGD